MYLTYEEYEEYGGTLDETAYNTVYYEAQSYIDWLTFNRLSVNTTYPTQVKRCVFDLVNLINNKRSLLLDTNANADSSVAGMENDGVKITYNVMSATELFDKLILDVNKIVSRYLLGVTNSKGKLLTYRGVYEDE